MDDEQRAYLEAYALLEGVQAHDPQGALAEVEVARRRASRFGWTRVELVLKLVAIVHDLVHVPDARTRGRVDDLVVQARHAGEPALVACALGVRGVLSNIEGDTRQMLEDAAAAMVLLDDEDLPAQDRATGYTILAAAYASLQLWELVDELYELSARAGSSHPDPVMRAALAINPVIVRVEWALGLVEVGDDEEARHQLARAAQAMPAAQAADMPWLWREVRAGFADIITMLTTGELPDAEQLAARIELLRANHDREVLHLLEATRVLAQYRAATTWRERRRAAAAAVALDTTVSASSSSTFPTWVRSHVTLQALRPRRRPFARARRAAVVRAAGQDYVAALASTRWTSRRAVLAAAYAQISVARSQAERERLVHAASTDPLTGLGNRRVFDDWLSGEDSTVRPSALLLVDVDDFKGVNDTHGHALGDEVLRALATVLRECEAAGDVSVRLGGDEFAVLVPRAGTAEALVERADQIVERVRTYPWSALAPGLQVSVSTGTSGGGRGRPVPVVDGDVTGRAATYRRADADLYAGKRTRVATSEPR